MNAGTPSSIRSSANAFHDIPSDRFEVFKAARRTCSSTHSTQITSHMEIHNWMGQFEDNRRMDHADTLGYLADIKNNGAIMMDIMASQTEYTRQLMMFMQNVRAHHPAATATRTTLWARKQGQAATGSFAHPAVARSQAQRQRRRRVSFDGTTLTAVTRTSQVPGGTSAVACLHAPGKALTDTKGRIYPADIHGSASLYRSQARRSSHSETCHSESS